MRLLVSSLLILLCLGTLPSRAETLVWSTTSFPPGYITEGLDKGDGYADRMENFMRSKLPQYDHEIIEYPNWERALNHIRNGPLACTSILWYRPKAERWQIKGAYRISAPNGVFFLHDVVVHKDKRALFGDEVSFKDLLANRQLRFGYNRPYGITFNRILGDHIGLPQGVELDAIDARERLKYLRASPNVYIRSGGDIIGGTIRMLLNGRIDYILEYDFMVKYQKKRLGLTDELAVIPVTEVKDKVAKIAFACSDTPAGEKAIAAINKVLKDHRQTPAFKHALEYLVPTGREELYWREYEKILTVYD